LLKRKLMMRTYVPKPDEIPREWLVMDASEQVLGRLATEAARLLRGKHKPQYTPHVDTGDFVVVVNAEKVRVTGRKLEDKKYYRHSGRPGNLRVETLRERLEKYPERVIRAAVWGMLPKNRLGRRLLRKLKVYRGPEHPHDAQQPKAYTW
jgi:large subunit ribosomal protein L13